MKQFWLILVIILLASCQNQDKKQTNPVPTSNFVPVIVQKAQEPKAQEPANEPEPPMCTKKITDNCWIPTDEINTETPRSERCLYPKKNCVDPVVHHRKHKKIRSK